MAKDLSELPKSFDPEEYRADAEKLGEQVAEYMQQGYMNGLRKSDIATRRAFEQHYSSIGYQLEFGIISQEEYFEKLAAIRDRYFAKDTQEWYKYTLEIYNGKMQLLYDYEATVQSHLQKLADAQDAYAQKLYKSVGSGVGYDTKVTTVENYYPNGDPIVITEYSLSQLDKDIAQLKAYDETLKNLQARAESLDVTSFRTFFEEIRTLSIEDANRLATLLLQSSDQEFIKYLSNYQEKKDLTERIAGSVYETDFQTAAEDIRREIETAFSDIPAEFFSYGEITAENFKTGFQEHVKNLFTNIDWSVELDALSREVSQAVQTTSHTYAPTYHLHNQGETTTQQLIAARNHAAIEALRQGTEF